MTTTGPRPQSAPIPPSPSPRLAGRRIVVTGAGGGLGQAIALRLASEGACLVLTDLDADALRATAAVVQAGGSEVVVVAGDIKLQQTAAEVAAAATTAFSGIDGLCNVAGVSPAIPLEDTTGDDFDWIMGVNCKAQLLMIQACTPALRESADGAIVNISSVGGRVALPNLTVYGASKAAVLGLTRGVAFELAGDGVRCNAVCPGGIDTPMADAVVGSFANREEAISQLTGRQLFNRFAHSSEIAGLVAFLVSSESSFITGSTFDCDAGHTAS